MTTATSYREELADFLRTRRARLSPSQVGLPTGLRPRRTPGLRREEVAQLASIGLTWYTWLEQGRDISVSNQVLESLAQALHLNQNEREHLFRLALRQVPSDRPTLSEKVNPSIQKFIDSLPNTPAFVIGQRWDVIAWNRAALALYVNFEKMPLEDRNIVRLTFTAPEFREILADWENHAQRLLAQFRADCSQFVGETWLVELVEELTQRSPEFRKWWPRHDVLGNLEGRKELNHPLVGRLVLEHLTFEVFDNTDLKLIVYTPTDEHDTKAKMERLLKSLN